jgi:tetratricopeptide (TPR) repeat protein
VLKLEPRLPEAHVNMGFALLGLKRYDTALASFETALGLRSSQANAYYGMALALKGLKDTEGAIGSMRSYIHLSTPDDPYLNQARTNLAEWETARGRKPGGDLPAVKMNPPR